MGNLKSFWMSRLSYHMVQRFRLTSMMRIMGIFNATVDLVISTAGLVYSIYSSLKSFTYLRNMVIHRFRFRLLASR